MKPRERIHKPLLGFGPAGWILLAIFLALVIAVSFDVDVQLHVQYLVDRVFGTDVMLYITGRTYTLLFPIYDPSPSVISAWFGLVAFSIAPFRFKRSSQLLWFVINTCWLTFSICVYLDLSRGLLEQFNGGTLPFHIAYELPEYLGIVLCGTLATALSRSRLVAAGWVVALLFSIAVDTVNNELFHSVLFYPVLDVGWVLVMPLQLLFTAASSGSLLLWAILERRKPFLESLCPTCAYDLAGLSPSVPCPECGEPPSVDSNPNPPGAVVLAAGENHDPLPTSPSPSPKG